MDSAKWAAVESAHMVTLVPPAPARGFIDRYKQEWSALGRAEDKLPLLGISRHVVLAETEAEARKAAERAYRPWVKHMELLWVKNGTTLPLGLPPEFAQIEQAGAAYAGTPAGFIEYVKAQEAATGATYFVCDVAFGDLSYEESLRTVNLLGEKVLPAFA
jgi:alkanesulfonate monooxygenase SsuD/methylene tetrahydromethanopterin reductase-like flavin-dependent oxidoreductase (luciferase family)